MSGEKTKMAASNYQNGHEIGRSRWLGQHPQA